METMTYWLFAAALGNAMLALMLIAMILGA